MTTQSVITLQERRVICHACSMGCKMSKVYPEFPTDNHAAQTIYYDEDGRLHIHSSVRRVTKYKCSNGHAWIGTDEMFCWCGWKEADAPKQ